MYRELYELLKAASEAEGQRVVAKIRRGMDVETVLRQGKDSNVSGETATASHESPVLCFQELVSWTQCRAHPGNHGSQHETDQSTILTLPPRPLDAYMSLWHQDTWTQTGWTKAHIHHLIDAISSWDYLPFSLLSYHDFLQSFYSDSSQFCSPALVCAILALACHLVNEDRDDLEVLPSGWVGSTMFLDLANEKLHQDQPKGLPDIQAIGILSLYHLRRGREDRAHECADDFVAKIQEFDDPDSPVRSKGSQQYETVLDITYCGAVSLFRILLLATGKIFNIPHAITPAPASILKRLYQMMQSRDGDAALNPSERSLQLLSLQYISGKVFELTEWVYDFVESTRSNIRPSPRYVRAFYEKCLDWYKEIFAYAENDCARTPFVLFVQ
ncbi:uncharacterized protein MAM_00373 [Metarhizium album ARSEF 1941]|uniref:Uncharacterized protein n=1 Tax=Metarhizium album (strain ARSEF 1941) TaxID=1081103 RepID=A0A0B2WYM5_METAS|nr:uncharacterized protein MAM_00373 [Metarhizium album ARSEF 1941]KHO01372.1 hypothetical protein MAM_00373 [Metarhizium album ARSEF 1941]